MGNHISKSDLEYLVYYPDKILSMNKFKSQVNSNILDELNTQEKQVLKWKLYEILQKRRVDIQPYHFNYSLAVAQMYYNHLTFTDMNMREPINDIISIVGLYSKEYKKKVYLLGECHYIIEDDDGQSAIEQWIIKYLNQSDRLVDIFIEQWFTSIDRDATLQRFRQHLKDCFPKHRGNAGTDENKCPYNNARFHFVDVREFILPGEFISTINNYLNADYEDQEKIKEYILDFLSDHQEIFQDKKTFLRYIITPWLKHTKIIRQFNYMNYNIEKILDQQIEHWIDQYLGDNPYNVFYDAFIINESYDAYQDYNGKMENFIDSLMDIYAIARFMRIFNDKYTSRYAFIYCGNTHSKNQQDILQLLGFEIVSYQSIDMSDISCFDVEQLHQRVLTFPDKIPFDWREYGIPDS